MDEDKLIKMAGLGAFLTAYSGARGIEIAADGIFDFLGDLDDTSKGIQQFARNPVIALIKEGRKLL